MAAFKSSLTALCLLVGILLPAQARAEFCSDKANGWWCSGSNLVVCMNGFQDSSEYCQCGCKSMPPGEADKCKPCGGFCSDQTNGWWCNGETLVVCQNGAQTSSENCPCGCQGMPQGEPDKCKSCGGFCSDKVNGWWCDGEYLVLCQGGSETSSEKCECGCKSMPQGEPDKCLDCGGGFCAGKGDGWWCDGDWRIHCSNGQQTNSEKCDDGCAGGGGQAVCSDGPDPGFCDGKDNGLWCNGSNLLTCQGGVQTAAEACPFGCLSMPEGEPDKCAEEEEPPEGFCPGKGDGSWCNENTLTACEDGAESWSIECEVKCEPMPDGIPAVCKDQEGTFCLDKGDGYWCNGNLLTLCEVGKIGSSIACSNGCQSMQDGVDDQCKSNNPGTPDGDLLSVSKQGQCGVFSGTIDLWAGTGLSAWNQKDHDKDTIGTCDGLTIKSSGCLITSLAMLYEYLEKYRTVNGKTGNSPPMEDDWRTKKVNGATRGYAATTYTVDGAEKSGNCMAYLSTNPSGVSLQYHYNTAAGCIEYQAAVSIANSLNSGLPVVAGVHWISGKEDQHWVLVTGADADGVFFNDPWGGAKNVRPANGKLGSYTIDTFFTPYMAGIGGPDEDGTAFGENGQPLALDLATSRLPTILEESSDTEPTPDGDDVVGPADASPEIISEQPKTKSGGCAHGTGNPTGAMLVLILLLALACRRTAKEY